MISDDFNNCMSVQEGLLLKRALLQTYEKKILSDPRDFRISELWKVIVDGNRHFIDE